MTRLTGWTNIWQRIAFRSTPPSDQIQLRLQNLPPRYLVHSLHRRAVQQTSRKVDTEEAMALQLSEALYGKKIWRRNDSNNVVGEITCKTRTILCGPFQSTLVRLQAFVPYRSMEEPGYRSVQQILRCYWYSIRGRDYDYGEYIYSPLMSRVSLLLGWNPNESELLYTLISMERSEAVRQTKLPESQGQDVHVQD